MKALVLSYPDAKEASETLAPSARRAAEWTSRAFWRHYFQRSHGRIDTSGSVRADVEGAQCRLALYIELVLRTVRYPDCARGRSDPYASCRIDMQDAATCVDKLCPRVDVGAQAVTVAVG
jgi:hypothetical protein